MTSPQTYPQPESQATRRVAVAVDMPGLGPLDYLDTLDQPLAEGDWVCVPLGRRRVPGLVVRANHPAPEHEGPLKAVIERLYALPPWSADHLRLISFVARYYRRSLGAAALSAVPAWLRRLKVHEPRPNEKPSLALALEHTIRTRQPFSSRDEHAGVDVDLESEQATMPFTSEQQQALEALDAFTLRKPPPTTLLHGLTGTGKTRLYQAAISRLLEREPNAQILVLVPEIGLTPQLVERMQRAFPRRSLALLHSGLTERQRAENWLRASLGAAQIVLGTRLAILSPIPRLAMIVVDEEHDASYKQQEGLRYSARDLAVWLGADRSIPVLLASATPSLETWAQVSRGRYERVTMRTQASGAQRPSIDRIDLLKYPAGPSGLSAPAQQAIERVIRDQGQVLLFVNRRGWAPVLICDACGWRTNCRDCTAPTVLHRPKGRWRTICHHCGLVSQPPSACPDCGHQDLSPLGQGTQRLEASLATLFPGSVVARMDRDEIRTPKDLENMLTQIHAGEVSILVGTQMAAKGHDFERLRLVVVVDADGQLANPDFRGPEWLYAGIAQVAGRAGRHPDPTGRSTASVLIQTRYPNHPVFLALADPDPMEGFARYWNEMALEREQSGLPPYGSMALICASHREEARVVRALEELSVQIKTLGLQGVQISAPVPRYPERVAGRTRWQLILESHQRRALQHALDACEPWVQAHRAKLNAQIEVDPLSLS